MEPVGRAQPPPPAAAGKAPLRRRFDLGRARFDRSARLAGVFDDRGGLGAADVLRSDDARRRGDERRQARRLRGRFGGRGRLARKRRVAVGTELARPPVAPVLALAILEWTIGPRATILLTVVLAVLTALKAAAIDRDRAVALVDRALDVGLATDGAIGPGCGG